jgi:hypothetical protein
MDWASKGRFARSITDWQISVAVRRYTAVSKSLEIGPMPAITIFLAYLVGDPPCAGQPQSSDGSEHTIALLKTSKKVHSYII